MIPKIEDYCEMNGTHIVKKAWWWRLQMRAIVVYHFEVFGWRRTKLDSVRD